MSIFLRAWHSSDKHHKWLDLLMKNLFLDLIVYLVLILNCHWSSFLYSELWFAALAPWKSLQLPPAAIYICVVFPIPGAWLIGARSLENSYVVAPSGGLYQISDNLIIEFRENLWKELPFSRGKYFFFF